MPVLESDACGHSITHRVSELDPEAKMDWVGRLRCSFCWHWVCPGCHRTLGLRDKFRDCDCGTT